MKALRIVVPLLALAAAGCSKDEEVLEFSKEIETVSAEIVSKVDTAQDLSTGIDGAQALLDSKRESLRTKFKALEHVRGFQVKKESLTRLTEAVTKGTMSVAGLRLKHMGKTFSKPELDGKLKKLSNDYLATFGEAPAPDEKPVAAAEKPAAAEKAAEPATPAEKPDLDAVIGVKKDGWAPKIVKALRRGMKPADVAKLFPGSEPKESSKFSSIPGGTKGLEEIEFYFADGKKGPASELYSVTLKFDDQLTDDAFYTELVQHLSRKYGKTKPTDVEKKLVTWVSPRFDTAQLTKRFDGDGYALKVSLAK